MRRRLHILKDYLRYKKHKQYVEERVVELRSKITMEAIETGCADKQSRRLFLKYNEYLKNLSKNTN
tara:strand:- start:13217 stop:13414 length:198 start_codon:yes stop_codon:yes gene_type:complete